MNGSRGCVEHSESCCVRAWRFSIAAGCPGARVPQKRGLVRWVGITDLQVYVSCVVRGLSTASEAKENDQLSRVKLLFPDHGVIRKLAALVAAALQ